MMRYTVYCPSDKTVILSLKGGTKVRFECDYEYAHEHEIIGAEVEAIILDPEKNIQIVLPSDAEFSDYITVEDERIRETNSNKTFSSRVMPEFQNVDDEPENIGLTPVHTEQNPASSDKDFLQAQLSTKHQMIIRNIMAVVSALAVTIAYILEKLGIM